MWKRRSSKYNAVRTIRNGISFASCREANRYSQLLLELAAGKISDLKLQPKYMLQPAFDKNGVHYRPIFYIADFIYKDAQGNLVIEDVKGYKKDRVFLMKQKMFEYVFRTLQLRITR